MPIINDTTLRDGEQTPYVAFNTKEKLKIARLLYEAGADELEVGIPAMGKKEQDDLKEILALELPIQIMSWNRATLSDLEASLSCGLKAVDLSIPVSDMKMELFKIEQYVEMALNYLRVEDISSDLSFKQYAVDDMVRQVIRKYAKIFISKKIKMNFKPTGRYIVTDDKWFVFVLEQLISNALKYTKKGQISIYMKEKSLVIEDTGIGIPAEDLPRIFEKGFTGYNGRENKKSTGIGPYLCKNIMDKLQWNITVDSEVGSGTKIYLTKM